ncbi:MAG: hypothetical protein GF310_00060 [candidate division Zixibacteria bacterium]|nr:hypothetical protein [candidate division Zixibacteria bacterium]
MYTVVMNICPKCGQIVVDSPDRVRLCCPVCRNRWRIYPGGKIEARLT